MAAQSVSPFAMAARSVQNIRTSTAKTSAQEHKQDHHRQSQLRSEARTEIAAEVALLHALSVLGALKSNAEIAVVIQSCPAARNVSL